jgi:thiol-disulfide isomerase/thioredoxin
MEMRRTVAAALMLVAAVSCRKSEKPVARGAENTATTTAQAGNATATAAKTDVGTAMPEYAALNLDGSKFDLAAKRDKVVLLNVWATWCGPCRYEIPELEKIHKSYTPRGLEVIGVSVDESGVDSVREFVTDQKMTYPIVLDADGKITSLLETSVLPTSVLVDRSGKIVWKKYGAIMENDEELKKAIEAAL